MNKTSYHQDNLKRDLIEKGLKILNEEGYENFSLRRVAKECGVSHTAPYRHFKNKEELIIAITSEALEKFNTTLKEAAISYPDDMSKQMNEMGFLYVKFFVENPDYLKLFFLSDIRNHISKDALYADSYDTAFNTFLTSIYKFVGGHENGDKLDKDAYALAAWSLVHGLSVLITRKDYPYEGDYLELAKKIIWKMYK